ncbi:Transcriptional regulator WAR1 [Pleurostoma richardsiae]|uniref:Transcriptional regulator WAR1 n=1 Tax=Pleurostoma richardsiae TaxID=41990 RepID=A0AA38RKM8_9PEZI|nr:Transcriptional regulator WAR1 [Pleurostoma richardsiae]
MDNSNAARAKSGRWGSACASCASAKAKCLRSDGSSGSACDRCKRLFKECTDQIHHPRKKRASKPSRTAQLEERLNGLVDLLSASGELPLAEASGIKFGPAPSSLPDRGTRTGMSSPARDDSHERSPASHGDSSSGGLISVPSTYNCYAPPRCICRVDEGSAPAQTESDEQLLATYQAYLTPTFPYVIIPRTTSPRMLQSTRPFLWAAIKKVATLNSIWSMKAQMYAMIRHLSEHMLVRSERSLDLLQGIIVILGWYQHHCMMHAQMNNLVHLAASLVADLGLNRPPGVQERTAALVMEPEEPPPRTNEERRALLAVWYLTSTISIGYQKIDAMKFSPYVQECLRDLEASMEYESDSFLIYTLRLQNLTQQVRDMNLRCGEPEDIPGIPRAPNSAYQLAFQTELDRIRASLPQELKENRILGCQIQTAMLHLYEPPVLDASLLKKMANTADIASSLDTFYRSGRALRCWFDNWLSMPVESYLYVPLPTCSQLVYAIIILVRWSKLVGPGVLQHEHNSADNIGVPSGPPMDPSSRLPLPLTSSFGVGLAPPPEFGISRDPGAGTVASGHKQAQSNVSSTGENAPFLTAFRAHVLSQPDLSIDILGILAALATQFNRVNEEMTKSWGGVWQNNIWDLSAKKVLVSRTKVERWARMMSASAMNSREDTNKNANSDGTRLVPYGQVTTPGVMPRMGPAEPLGFGAGSEPDCSLPGWDYPNAWFNNLFDHVDPSLWFDDTADWSGVVMQPMGTSMLQ